MANGLARRLRKTMTRQEVKLWVRLRELRPLGFHFRRQAPRDGYILDFVCLRRLVVIEVDGDQHGRERQRCRDAVRDRHFSTQGYRVLRFWNFEVDQNLDGVLAAILEVLEMAPHPVRYADHPPPSGEG